MRLRPSQFFRIFLFSIVTSLFGYSEMAYAQNLERIRWVDEDKLNWEDFKGKPRKNHPMAAETSTHLDFSMAYEQGEFTWELDCYFSKKESWVKKDMKSEDLLVHEQLHFDIAELHARRIRSEMSALKLKSIDDNKKLQSVFEKGYERMSKEQIRYDKETNHGLLDNPQLRWIDRITKELKQYEDYSTEKYQKTE